jgi:hypothetical protein
MRLAGCFTKPTASSMGSSPPKKAAKPFDRRAGERGTERRGALDVAQRVEEGAAGELGARIPRPGEGQADEGVAGVGPSPA